MGTLCVHKPLGNAALLESARACRDFAAIWLEHLPTDEPAAATFDAGRADREYEAAAVALRLAVRTFNPQPVAFRERWCGLHAHLQLPDGGDGEIAFRRVTAAASGLQATVDAIAERQCWQCLYDETGTPCGRFRDGLPPASIPAAWLRGMQRDAELILSILPADEPQRPAAATETIPAFAGAAEPDGIVLPCGFRLRGKLLDNLQRQQLNILDFATKHPGGWKADDLAKHLYGRKRRRGDETFKKAITRVNKVLARIGAEITEKNGFMRIDFGDSAADETRDQNRDQLVH